MGRALGNGRAEPGQAVIEAAFAFENTGDDPVTITRVTSSCGCTTPRLDQRTYAPGETGAILAHFEIGDRTGRHSSRIIVRTAPAPGNPGSSGSGARGNSTTTLTLRSEIPELVRLPARVVHWRPDEPREPRMIPLKLTHADALRIHAVRSEGESVTATLKPVPVNASPEAADDEHADADATASRPVADAAHGEASSADASPTSPRHYELMLVPTGEAGRSRVLLDVALADDRTRMLSLSAHVLATVPGSRDGDDSAPAPSAALSR